MWEIMPSVQNQNTIFITQIVGNLYFGIIQSL